ncbi:hypothetical protein [Mesorhizobium sp.]|uniref:hypothetical protein n=1 Tax=Mesorhizobium sp. TaxID=1871066 RepID=UPI0012101470|nr:hypothetical protein [Mesorhizobium sp.]TIN24021.1 MAG: hypothetical protein E5Y19_24140 [Mesorhizobium sp.]
MTSSSEIAPYLPSLRRYSTAVAGSQMIGDAWWLAMLEELVADFSIFPSASSPRTGLYALYSRFYASALDRVPTWNLAGGSQSGDTDVMLLSPVRRQALLLVAAEGFDMVEAAETLRVSEEEFEEILTSAYADVVIQRTSHEGEISMCTLANATTSRRLTYFLPTPNGGVEKREYTPDVVVSA